MFVIKYRKLFLSLSVIAVALSLVSIFYFGLNLGIDFKGGTIVEVEYVKEVPTLDDLRTSLNGNEKVGVVAVQPTGERGFIFRTKNLSEIEKDELIAKASLDKKFTLIEKRSSSIGPTMGKELAYKGVIAITLVVLLIIAFIALVFRGVSRPVASWKYGVIAVLALIHDITIPTGVFAALGYFRGTEIDALFLTALLTILGLSVNDTIVVFDRIRENLKNKVAPHFEDVVGMSLSQTFTRSINTSLTVILALLALLFFGGSTTRDFALVLTIGMVVGTYSSIFVASPLLVVWEKWARK
jgi:preprotein translocase subunit SecF